MSNGDLIFEAIRNLPTSTVGILPALEKVKSILSSREDPRIEPEELQDSEQATGQDPETTGMSVEMLSFDCIDPSKARIRIYTKTHNTSFANVQDIYTLGGQLNSIEVTARLKALKEFWTSLLILPDDWDEYEDQSAETLYFGFEIIPGRKDPDVEVFVPSWSCGVDRMGLTRGLSRYFKERGWDVGGKYKGDIQEVL
jgi:tryptophan 7-dimethylallyltransferase